MATLTRATFQATAESVRDQLTNYGASPVACEAISDLARDLARQFGAGNSRFDATRFYVAAGLDRDGHTIAD